MCPLANDDSLKYAYTRILCHQNVFITHWHPYTVIVFLKASYKSIFSISTLK